MLRGETKAVDVAGTPQKNVAHQYGMTYMNCYRGKNPEMKYDDGDHARMADHLIEAEAIKKDKGVMKGIQKHLDAKSKAITSIAGLREAGAKAKEMEENDGEPESTESPARKTIKAVDRK